MIVAPFALLVLFAFLAPTVSGPRAAIPRDNAAERIRRIGLAILEYEQSYKVFPPAYTVDASGNKLHSWRAIILPYLDQGELYMKIDFSKPWDAPENAAARATAVTDYEPYDMKLPPGQTLHHV